MLRPFGLSVPSSKISLISWFFRRVLSPLQRLRPQIMMSLSEWEAELKCSATGKPGELFRTLRRCSLKRSRSRLPVSSLGTLRYPGRGQGRRQPEVNSHGLSFNLHKCHATWRPPPQLRRRRSLFWRPLRKVSYFSEFFLSINKSCTKFTNITIRKYIPKLSGSFLFS